jgi:hypothetical protein
MNYKYIPDQNDKLKTFISRHPAASLDEIRRKLPALRPWSLDHLSLRLGQLRFAHSLA